MCIPIYYTTDDYNNNITRKLYIKKNIQVHIKVRSEYFVLSKIKGVPSLL